MSFFSSEDDVSSSRIFDSSGNEILSNSIVSVEVSPSNTFAEHILEDGTVVIDNAITNKDRIIVKAILDSDTYADDYQTIKTLSDSRDPMTIQSRVDTHVNMYIESFPHSETAQVSGTIPITLSFVEQQIAPSIETALPEERVKEIENADTPLPVDKIPQEDEGTLIKLADKLAELRSGLF